MLKAELQIIGSKLKQEEKDEVVDILQDVDKKFTLNKLYNFDKFKPILEDKRIAEIFFCIALVEILYAAKNKELYNHIKEIYPKISWVKINKIVKEWNRKVSTLYNSLGCNSFVSLYKKYSDYMELSTLETETLIEFGVMYGFPMEQGINESFYVYFNLLAQNYQGIAGFLNMYVSTGYSEKFYPYEYIQTGIDAMQNVLNTGYVTKEDFLILRFGLNLEYYTEICNTSVYDEERRMFLFEANISAYPLYLFRDVANTLGKCDFRSLWCNTKNDFSGMLYYAGNTGVYSVCFMDDKHFNEIKNTIEEGSKK